MNDASLDSVPTGNLMTETVANAASSPKLFISYSWSNPDHEQWVMTLAEELVAQGIDVKLDKWDLKTGHDAYAFMEQMVADPDVTKVILICDKKYAEKSNAREGGAGTEAQIITPELYSKKEQDKFAAVVREYDEDGHPCLPIYYKGRIFINLSDDAIYAAEFEKLVRWAWNKPLYVKPPIGTPPSFVFNDPPKKIASATTFRRAIDAIRNGRPAAVPATVEYLDVIASGLELFRIAGTPQTINTFDDAIVKSIEDFAPFRNELTELFLVISAYYPTEEMIEALHRFFERLITFHYVPDNISTSYKIDCDNTKFIIHELFLLCIASFIKSERFKEAAPLIESEYYFVDKYTAKTMHTFSIFRDYLESFERRKNRLKSNRISLVADLLKERASAGGIDFKYLMSADFILWLRSHLNPRKEWRSVWYPETLVYVSFRSYAPIELFARSKSARYFERVKPLLGVKDKAELEALVARLEANTDALPNWDYERLNPRHLLQLDAIATTV